MSIREDSTRSGLSMKKKVINELYDKYVETKRRINDDEISKMFLNATNGRFVQNNKDEDNLVVDLDGNFDILQGLLNKETDFSMKDMFKIKHSDFINRFIGITTEQETITKICKDVAEEYANLRIKNNKAPEKQRDKEMEDAFNYCLINTNHMFSQEINEYKRAFESANKDRLQKLKAQYYLPHWVVISMKLPDSTLNWNRNMLGNVNMSNQLNSFLRQYNKKNGEVQGYFEFLNIENPLSNGGSRKLKRRKTLKNRRRNRKGIKSKRYKKR
jgi:hypothetical protein